MSPTTFLPKFLASFYSYCSWSLCEKNNLCVKCLGETTLQQFQNGIGWGRGGGGLRWLYKITCRWWSLIKAKKTMQPDPQALCMAKYWSIMIMYGSAVVATWHGTFTMVNSLCMIIKCAWNLNGMLNYKRTVVRTSFECMHEPYLWERRKK